MTKDSKETQHEKFQRVARELETDEAEEAFDRVSKKVVKSRPPKGEKVASSKVAKRPNSPETPRD
ncbi:DNA-binding protein [Mesorhizobium sp. ISC11]